MRAGREDEADDRSTDHRERDSEVPLAIGAAPVAAESGDARLALAILRHRDLRVHQNSARVIRSV